MRQYKNGIKIVLTVSLSLLFVALGCTKSKTVIVEKPPPKYSSPAKKGPPPWAPAHGYRGKHRYHYYPSSRVYYDTDRKLYFYLEGENWRFGASLPTGMHVDVGDHVSLEMDTDKPYEFHSDVVKKYPPGQLKKKGKAKGKKQHKDKGKSKEKWD